MRIDSMMDLQRRVQAFVQLGKVLNEFSERKDWRGYDSGVGENEFNDFNATIGAAKHHNGWFTEESVRQAISAIAGSLTENKIGQWLEKYGELSSPSKSVRVGVIMAGNIPLVGFHDMLCVLMSGHKLVGKCSSQDDKLMPFVVQFLLEIEPDFKDYVEFTMARLPEIDAVIATGSNNSARYFDYYFGKYPNIIRKHRTSVAVLTGDEDEEELKGLGKDVFTHFGLGCRNVSKLYVPKDYDLDNVFKALFDHHDIINHQKYANNYDYNKTLFLMNQDNLLENGFVILKEEKILTSPVATLYYEYYDDEAVLNRELTNLQEQIQCVVSNKNTPFGKAQSPELWDYADNVDTMKFLLGL